MCEGNDCVKVCVSVDVEEIDGVGWVEEEGEEQAESYISCCNITNVFVPVYCVWPQLSEASPDLGIGMGWGRGGGCGGLGGLDFGGRKPSLYYISTLNQVL